LKTKDEISYNVCRFRPLFIIAVNDLFESKGIDNIVASFKHLEELRKKCNEKATWLQSKKMVGEKNRDWVSIKPAAEY
jgi:hypothetical protein